MNILLTSVGRRAYLVKYFKDALEGNGEIHVSNSEYSIAMESADEYLITPLIYESNYISTILDYCIKNKISVILSLFDIDLLVLSKNEKQFQKNGIKLILAPEDSIRICNDKWATYNLLKRLKIKTPQTFLTIDSAINSIKNNDISYPLIIKPRWGMASLSIYVVENEEELKVLFNKASNEIFKSYLKYESSFTKENPIIIQEHLLGQEYGLDIVNDLESKYVTTFAKKKIRMRAGETDIGETVSENKFLKIAKQLSEVIKHQGILSVDCFICSKEILVIEMNCRISGHYPVSHIAGANFPKQLLLWLNNKETKTNLLKINEGLIITKDLIPKALKIPNKILENK